MKISLQCRPPYTNPPPSLCCTSQRCTLLPAYLHQDEQALPGDFQSGKFSVPPIIIIIIIINVVTLTTLSSLAKGNFSCCF